MIMTKPTLILNILLSLTIEMSINENFYIEENKAYELITIEEIRKLLNEKTIYVAVEDIEKIKKYYPITDEIEDKIITDDPHIKYCSTRLIDLSKDPINSEKCNCFLSEWDSYLQMGKRLTNHEDYPHAHVKEIREGIGNYFKANNNLLSNWKGFRKLKWKIGTNILFFKVKVKIR